MQSDQLDRVRRYYGAWAATYGGPAEGWFAAVRARESRLVHALLDLRGSESILDVGCGSGLYARPLHQKGHPVWALDIAPEMVDRVRGHVDHCFVGSVDSLALPKRFDRILCLGVLEFVPDAASAVRRLIAHLAPRGRLVVLVPRTGPGGWLYRREKRKHGLDARLFAPSDLRQMAEQVGGRYLCHRTPFPHNFVMAFQAPVQTVRARRHATMASHAAYADRPVIRLVAPGTR